MKQAAEAERIQAEGFVDSNQPKLDLGLKEGQKIRLNLNTRRSGDTESGNNGSTRSRPMPSLKLGGPLGSGGLIPPPPGPAATGNRNRQFRGTVGGGPSDIIAPSAAAAPQSSITGKSNIDLLADIFQSPAPPPTSQSNPTNPTDFSLI